MLSCLARTPFKPVNNDSDDDSDCNSDATPTGSPDRTVGGRQLIDGSRCLYVDSRRLSGARDPAAGTAAAEIVGRSVEKPTGHCFGVQPGGSAPASLLIDCRSAGPDLFPFYRGLVTQLAKRPSRYAKLVFSSTNGATDEFIVNLRTTLPTTLQPRVISLRADGVPTHELGQMGFRQNALPAYVRADYGRLLESEDSL